ncbi:SDR family oxidoreductase [Nocardioides mangrovicus]|uniref:SDR family oxidoreductase n=1 Tax=Nocardioides mangrovicus TaxID=2478913 RepID=A0A3L8NXV8_9ACTN|nr:SDR family NAD(P)-dependent oxidoreductase [Nocardioides mangrovicus]RLV47467.1 SDR family oxidoreductase [Nocardioides mangrovicus]
MGKLKGAVAIVTGGASGMGASHVRGLVAEGAQVVVADIAEDAGRALVDELGDSARFFRLDVTVDEQWAAVVAYAEQELGPVTILLNNAGVVQWKPWEAVTTAEWRRVVDINLTGQFIGIREVVPSMRRSGHGVIINVSSTAGLIGFANEAAYVASKWGVRGLTKAAALEFAPDHIRVLSVHPGGVVTPMTKDVTEESYRQQPIPRLGEPDEVTKLVLFLAADATYSTGSEWVVDGGAVLGPVVPVPVE